MNELYAGLWGDVKYSSRRLAASPTYLAFSVLIISIGVGVITAAYSAINSVLVQPSAVPDVTRVVNLYHSDPRQRGSLNSIAFAWADFRELQASSGFGDVAGFAPFRQTFASGSRADLLWGELVTGNYFQLLGIRPALGRLIQPSDDGPDAPAIMVLSHAAWLRLWGGSASVIGSTARVNGSVFEIVGVAPAEYRGAFMSELVPTNVWVPLASAGRLSMPGQQFKMDYSDRENRWVLAKTRLKSGMSVKDADAQVKAIASALDREFPLPRSAEPGRGRRWVAIGAADIHLHGQERFIWPLAKLAMAALVLVGFVALTNLANLTLARVTSRKHDTATRLALGASRARIFRDHMIESILLSLAGGGAGVLLAALATRALANQLDVGPGLAISIDAQFDARVMLVAFASSVAALAVFGLLPALRASHTDVRVNLGTAGSTVAVRWRVQKRLIAVQVSVSSLLFVATALCAVRVAEQLGRTRGLDLHRLAVIQLAPLPSAYDEGRTTVLADDIVALLSARADVESAAVASGLPGMADLAHATILADGQSRTNENVSFVAATPALFRAVGLVNVRGRAFESSDNRGTDPIAIISRSLAEHLSRDHDVLGSEIRYQEPRSTGDKRDALETVRVVGIVEDVAAPSVGDRTAGVLYVPLSQHPHGPLTVITRARRAPARLIPAILDTIRVCDPDAAVIVAGTGERLAASNVLVPWVAGEVTAGLGMGALILSMVGLYGVLAHIVTARTREIGLRVALGATRSGIARLVIAEGLGPVSFGLCFGMGLAALLWKTAAGILMLHNETTGRLPIMALIVSALLAVAGLASYLPARRAAAVDPAMALRSE